MRLSSLRVYNAIAERRALEELARRVAEIEREKMEKLESEKS